MNVSKCILTLLAWPLLSFSDSSLLINELKGFVYGPEQRAMLQELVERLDSDSFIERERAARQLQRFPTLPPDLLESENTLSSPGVRFTLEQIRKAQSPVRTHALLRDLLERVSNSPRGIPTELVFDVVATHERGLYIPIAQKALNAIANEAGPEAMKNHLTHANGLVRLCAANSMIMALGNGAITTVEPLLSDPDDRVKLEVAFLLINLGHQPALDILITLTDSNSDMVRWRAKHLLSRLLRVNLQDEKAPRTNFAAFWREIIRRDPKQKLNIPVEMPSDIPLFEDAALSGWVEILNGQRLEQVTSWRYEGGILSCSGEGRGYLVTQQKFKNYVLQVEWKSKGDSGVGIMARRQEDPVRGEPPYLEVQTLSGVVGDLYLIGNFTARNADNQQISFRQPRIANPPEHEAWYRMKITVQNGNAEIIINDTIVNRVQGAGNETGHIVLRNEGDPISYRNLLVLPLE